MGRIFQSLSINAVKFSKSFIPYTASYTSNLMYMVSIVVLQLFHAFICCKFVHYVNPACRGCNVNPNKPLMLHVRGCKTRIDNSVIHNIWLLNTYIILMVHQLAKQFRLHNGSTGMVILQGG